MARYWPHPAVPGVNLLRARYVTHRYSKHTHETYTMALIEEGIEEFSHAGRLLRAGPGSVILVNPEVVHTGHAGRPEGWTYRVFYPAVDVVEAVAAELGFRPGTPRFRPAVVPDARSARLLRSAHRAANGDGLASSSLLHAAIAGLLSAHADQAPDGPPYGGPAHGGGDPGEGPRRARSAVRQARELLHDRVTTPPTLEELARLTGLGPHALLRAFRAQTGLPPHAYLNQHRVRLARGLLDRGVPAAQAAVAAGFADQAHFTRHFKRIVGVPPGAYQRARGARVRNCVQDRGEGRRVPSAL